MVAQINRIPPQSHLLTDPGTGIVEQYWYDYLQGLSGSGASPGGGLPPVIGVPAGKFLRDDISWQFPPNFSSSAPGYATASGGGTANFLRADGSWAAPPGTSAPTDRRVTGITLATGVPYSVSIDGTGATNVQSIIQTAWTACGLIYLPSGVYRIDSQLVGPTKDGAGIIGAASTSFFTAPGDETSTSATVIDVNFTGSTAIVSHTGIWQPTFQNLAIIRRSNGAAGAYGLDMGASCDHAYINNLYFERHYVGLRLRVCGYGLASNIRSTLSVSHGVEVTSQWQLSNILSLQNSGNGFHVTAPAGSGGISLGQWRGLATYANVGHGLAVIGTLADPVAQLRLSDSFFGNDTGDGVFLDTFQRTSLYHHLLTNVVCELETGSGFVFSDHCPGVSMVNCCAIGNSTHGVFSEATHTTIQGGAFNAHTVGAPSVGIWIFSGPASIGGASITGNDTGIAASVGVPALSYYGNLISGNTTNTDTAAASGVQAWGNY